MLSIGDSFQIIRANEVVGTFDAVTGLSNVEVAYEDDGVYAIVPTPCPVDLTGDGVVDVADILVMLGARGTPSADLNFDGTTDVADLLMLLGAWGAC